MTMSVTAIVGAQWGDEGKGRIVDLLAEELAYPDRAALLAHGAELLSRLSVEGAVLGTRR